MTNLDTTTQAPSSTPKPKKAKSVKAKAAKTKKSRSIVPARFKQAYAKHDDTNGSALAVALKEHTTTENKDGRECLDVAALLAVARANKIDPKPYASMNNGQKRMNIGNKLRGLILAGETVKIGSKVFRDERSIKPKAKAEGA